MPQRFPQLWTCQKYCTVAWTSSVGVQIIVFIVNKQNLQSMLQPLHFRSSREKKSEASEVRKHQEGLGTLLWHLLEGLGAVRQSGRHLEAFKSSQKHENCCSCCSFHRKPGNVGAYRPRRARRKWQRIRTCSGYYSLDFRRHGNSSNSWKMRKLA